MKEFKVAWIIELEAESPEDAARDALKIQRDQQSISCVFTVTDPEGNEQDIDLMEYVTKTEITNPIYLTVEMFQSVVSEVNVYQSEDSAKKAEQEWLEGMDIIDICDREGKEQDGTSFQIFVTNLLP